MLTRSSVCLSMSLLLLGLGLNLSSSANAQESGWFTGGSPEANQQAGAGSNQPGQSGQAIQGAPGWTNGGTPGPELSGQAQKDLEIPEHAFNRGFGANNTPHDEQLYGAPRVDGYGGQSLTKAPTQEIDLKEVMGPAYRTWFKFDNPSEYYQLMRKSGMPSTFNEQDGVDESSFKAF